jgi:FKBP-type peptidyl-prolyl cis-trans isomerase FklB
MKWYMKITVSVLMLTFSLAAVAQTKKKVPAATGTPPVVLKTAEDSLTYAIGLSAANFFKQQDMAHVKTNLVAQAIKDAEAGKAFLNKKEGDEFLAANKKKPGVVTLPDGLQYQVLKEGTGPKPAATDKVKCHYHGTLIDGKVFDSSVDRGQPIVISVSGVIKGWIEALQMMPVGSKWKLFIPSDLAYGDKQSGPLIGPGSTLVFEVELLDIEK